MIKVIVNYGGFILLSAIVAFILKWTFDDFKAALKFTGITVLVLSLACVAVLMMAW